MTDCIHGIDEAWCSLCRRPPRPAPISPLGHPFAARHGGQCPSCDLPVRPGEKIQKWSDERYRHVGC